MAQFIAVGFLGVLVNLSVGFMSASSVGAVVNFGTTLAVTDLLPSLPIQVAALCGITAGMGINFAANRFLVFRAKHIRPRDEGR
jgi:putative flippase GtrA